MKSEWRVSSQYFGDTHVFQVYRLLDTERIDHGGNREYVKNGIFNTKVAAQECADDMNRLDEEYGLAGR